MRIDGPKQGFEQMNRRMGSLNRKLGARKISTK